ncbi:Uncharacterised protein [uncultured archaeon]|nr:Uncharacterised protein [uncultured archaeon]
MDTSLMKKKTRVEYYNPARSTRKFKGRLLADGYPLPKKAHVEAWAEYMQARKLLQEGNPEGAISIWSKMGAHSPNGDGRFYALTGGAIAVYFKME